MITAYSYIRFSTPEQMKGDSLRRQLESSRSIAKAKGWHLDESLRDLGISAFKGAKQVHRLTRQILGHDRSRED